jgi:glucoamylase
MGLLLWLLLLLGYFGGLMPELLTASPAFGHPGISPRWTSARKQGVGTAYSSSSRVWFTIWQGIVTETYYPTVDRAQIRDWQFLLTDGQSFFHEEKRDFVNDVTPLSADSLGYRVTQMHTQTGYRLVKTIIAEPHTACVLQHVRVEAAPELLSRLHLYSLCSPHLGVGGANNNAYVCMVNGIKILVAHKKNTWLAMGCNRPFLKASCGFVGSSDGWTDLSENFQLDWQFDCALDGNVALVGEIDLTKSNEFVVAAAFGHGLHNAVNGLLQSLAYPFESQQQRFIAQWQRVVKRRSDLQSITSDGGRLLDSSHKILVAHEDKSNPGAFIASLSIPWGDSKGDDDLGGYHLVWPRDMVNSATGLLAVGNTDTPLRALTFLAAAQKPDGGFYQNFWISGDPYWTGVQLDEVSFPIMLAWRLKRHDVLKGFDPFPMVMAAARFLILHGPITQQDRWEEVTGFSPSTLAANISALTCAAAFARDAGDEDTAEFIQDYADYLFCHIEAWTVTTTGTLVSGIDTYFIRVNPTRSANSVLSPDEAFVLIANRDASEQQSFPARDIVDAGFLELVRYGVYAADSTLIKQSLAVVDSVLKVDTPRGPCWRRYNHDGYGQKATGGPFDSTGVGRAWPLLTGERGHYELAAGNDVSPYIRAMEQFATCGGTLPEQVWDTTDMPEAHLFLGEPTGAAMPLAWAHAEYLKLVRSATDGQVFDAIPEVYNRYVQSPATCKLIEIWHHGWQTPFIDRNFALRILTSRPFELIHSRDGWVNSERGACRNTPGLGVSYFDLNIPADQNAPMEFTFLWTDTNSWEGHNYTVAIRCARPLSHAR